MTEPMTDQHLQAIQDRNTARKRYNYCHGTQGHQDIQDIDDLVAEVTRLRSLLSGQPIFPPGMVELPPAGRPGR